MEECAGFINHSTGSVDAFHRALDLAEEKPGKRPTVEHRAVATLTPVMKAIMNRIPAPLRRATTEAFRADAAVLEGKQRTSLLTFLDIGRASLLQYMRQVRMRPVPYELKTPLPAKASTFSRGQKLSRREQQAQRRARNAMKHIRLHMKHASGCYVASTAVPLALSDEDTAEEAYDKGQSFNRLAEAVANRFPWLRGNKVMHHAGVPYLLRSQWNMWRSGHPTQST